MSDAPNISPSLTGRGTILGTLPYMAPEQLEGKPADARTDVFAFGAVLYEMLTGKKAFEGTSPASLIAAILSSGPPPIALQQPLIPPALDRVVTKCLAKDPDERWQSTHDLTSELQWIAESGVRIDIVRALADPPAQTPQLEPRELRAWLGWWPRLRQWRSWGCRCPRSGICAKRRRLPDPKCAWKSILPRSPRRSSFHCRLMAGTSSLLRQSMDGGGFGYGH